MGIPVINVEKTGANIRKLRKLNNISVSAIQDVFGFNTPQAIYKWEKGGSLPTLDNLVILARIFNTDINCILCIEEVGYAGC
jgi:transcriptional regulator with XRE-family HTH domain